MVAKTLFGFEELLAKELNQLGAQAVKIGVRHVSFVGDKGFMYKANLGIRTAIKILKPIANFKVINETDLYNKVKAIPWENYLKSDGTLAVGATLNGETFTHSQYVSLKTKDAIVDRFREQSGERPNVDLRFPDLKIDIHIDRHFCTVSLDSSGESLHKRGYKVATNIAPINEVLAAGLILLSDWNRIANFHDPMCGSGTLLIEAALIAHNIPANIFKERFGFESWKDFDEELWEKIKEISLEKETHYYGKITGSDNFQKAVRISRENIDNALMYDNIKVTKTDFFETEVAPGTFVMFNPPYGERIELGVNDFYEKVGTTLKHKYEGCGIWIISSDIENMKFIGLRPSRKIKVMNGKLDCSFRKFEVYEGSKKTKKQQD